MLMGGCTPVLTSADSADILVNGTGVVYTKSFKLGNGQYFGMAARAASVIGTGAVKIELEESPLLPTTEGAAETTRFVEPEGFSDIIDIADELMHVKTITPVPMMYGRYKITGAGGNPTDTIVNIWNFIQEHS
jgi:hypothetical protein